MKSSSAVFRDQPATGRLLRPAFHAGHQAKASGGSAPLLGMSTARILLTTLQWQIVGLAALASHIILVREIGAVCFPLIFVVLLLVNRASSLGGLIFYLQMLLYQNVAISFFSDHLSRSDYVVLSGTAFGGALVLAAVPALRVLNRQRPFQASHPELGRTARWIAIAIAVSAAYAVLGTLMAGLTPAAVGFRNATAILLAVVVGLDVGDRWGYRTIATCFLLSALFGLLLVQLEISDPDWYLSLVHAADFGNAKYSASTKPLYYTANDMILSMTSLPFNTEMLASLMNGLTYRFGGPNMHSISYGYLLAVMELTLLSLGYVLPVLPLLALSFMIGVKGAAILFIATTLLYVFWRKTGSLRALRLVGASMVVVYVGYGVWSGLKAGDFHVIGFMGGVNGFLANPFGHGLGVGGNLGLGSMTTKQWQEFQHNGANVGLESAVGVLLYQMGIGTAAFVAALVVLLRSAPFGAAPNRATFGRGRPRNPVRARTTDVLFIGLCIGLVNGVFQEEAYSPYATGLLALLCGVLIANGRRPTTPFEPAGV